MRGGALNEVFFLVFNLKSSQLSIKVSIFGKVPVMSSFNPCTFT